ncbi:hypothetical protein PF005_g12070 [Phytophthora fragariae]|uniref:Uncharacterized protein n=1 Tax=Phytophthora fragariae TaxID=53985 RepID=A0A6A3F8I7_9STRA|nr:hypothetical protein PF009_g11677 [Phytophthora fragariae]KAE9113706.1 hypothetical protein PF007_g10637 [Phytophthora fragariae]KAE9143480.1 hypothetical protein PF006_g11491 [Phytophthora fragariae]KAE9208790.1 hypothetical protein PF005_g12070 [Phytophthora fragariae]KAE9227616.1 hypothetical protein PF004_g11309 [Phytophthora fragariae]
MSLPSSIFTLTGDVFLALCLSPGRCFLVSFEVVRHRCCRLLPRPSSRPPLALLSPFVLHCRRVLSGPQHCRMFAVERLQPPSVSAPPASTCSSCSSWPRRLFNSLEDCIHRGFRRPSTPPSPSVCLCSLNCARGKVLSSRRRIWK